MERVLSKLKRKNPVTKIMFLLAGIFVLSLSLIFSSCGEAPKRKVVLPGKGSFAIDLSLADAGKVGYVVLVNPNRRHPSLDGTEFTVEAWVKSKTASLNGAIFSRYVESGIALYVKDNIPKFILRFQAAPTSTDYIVESDTAIGQDEWHHIAAVLVDEDHSGVHAACAGAEAETPHLDIYLDGVFSGCTSTNSLFAADTGGLEQAQIGRLLLPIDGLTDDNFDGIIDEVRLYRIAKTEAEINATKDRKLNDNEIESDDLLNYWNNDVGGGGFTVPDPSGGGYTGTIFQCDPGRTPTHPSCVMWDSSWTAGDWP